MPGALETNDTGAKASETNEVYSNEKRKPRKLREQLTIMDKAILDSHSKKVKIDLGELDEGDELTAVLKEWDTDGDGFFSTGELLLAAKDVVMQQERLEHARQRVTLYKKAIILLGIVLTLLLVALCGAVYFIVEFTKDASIASDGVASVRRGDEEGTTVSMGSVKEFQTLTGLFDEPWETLNGLSNVDIEHGGHYIRLAVNQLDRGTDTIEFIGCPGLVIIHRNGSTYWSKDGSREKLTIADGVGPSDFVDAEDRRLESIWDGSLMEDDEPPWEVLQAGARRGKGSYRGGAVVGTNGYRSGGSSGEDAGGDDETTNWIVLIVCGSILCCIFSFLALAKNMTKGIEEDGMTKLRADMQPTST